MSTATLQGVHLGAYTVHDYVFFFFLCFLPLGKHFHVITSIFNVFCMRLDTGNVKPVRNGIDESKLDAAFLPDVVGIDGLDGTILKVVRH